MMDIKMHMKWRKVLSPQKELDMKVSLYQKEL